MVLGSNTESIRRSVLEEVRQQTQDIQTAAGLVEDFTPIVQAAQAKVSTLESKVPADAPDDYQRPSYLDGATVWIREPYLDPAWTRFAGGADPFGLVKSDAAIEACAAESVATGIPMRFRDGDFWADDAVIPSGATVLTAGRGRTRFLRKDSANTYVFTAEGSIGSFTNLSADADEGAYSVTTATNPGLTAGGYAILTSSRQPWGSSLFPDWDEQEVLAVSGSGPYTITFKAGLSRSFAVADTARIAPMTPANVTFQDIYIEPDGSTQFQGIKLKYVAESLLEGVEVHGFATRGIDLESCLRTDVVRPIMKHPTDVGTNGGRGINLSNGTRDSLIERALGDGCRHLVSMTLGASYNEVRSGEARNSKGSSFDCHGTDVRHVLFAYCIDHNAPGVSFNAGNTSWGGDHDITYLVCKAIGISQASTSGQFIAVQGSSGIRWLQCEAAYGYNGFLVLNSNDCDVIESIARDNVNHAIRYNGAIGGDVMRNKIRNAGSRWFNSALSSDGQRIYDNDAQAALDLATVGSGTITRDNRYAA